MKIFVYPAPELRIKAETVTKEVLESQDFKIKLKELIEIAKQDGIGLAATQVGWPVSIFTVLVDKDLNKIDPEVFINPKVTKESKELVAATEGCLSFPGLEVSVKRPESICFEWEKLDGLKYSLETKYQKDSNAGYYIRVLQHETDHLAGTLLIDRVSPARRPVVEKWIKSQKI